MHASSCRHQELSLTGPFTNIQISSETSSPRKPKSKCFEIQCIGPCIDLELANDSAWRLGRFIIRITQRFKRLHTDFRSKGLRWHITYIGSSLEISPSETSPITTISSPLRCSVAFLFSFKLMFQTEPYIIYQIRRKVGSNVEISIGPCP